MIEIKVIVTTHMGRTVVKLHAPPSPLCTKHEEIVAKGLFNAIGKFTESISEKVLALKPGDPRRGDNPPEGFVPEG